MIYIALLRGINVGGNNIIKMAELRRVMEQAGLSRVQTYIQSGNVLFESETDEPALRSLIERTIEESFGIPVPVILRTAAQLAQAEAGCPFSEAEIREAEAASPDTECLYVGLLPDVPAYERVEKLRAYENEIERFQLVGREVYLLFRQSVRNSKLAAKLDLLGMPVTLRNRKTMAKLVALAGAMENAES